MTLLHLHDCNRTAALEKKKVALFSYWVTVRSVHQYCVNRIPYAKWIRNDELHCVFSILFFFFFSPPAFMKLRSCLLLKCWGWGCNRYAFLHPSSTPAVLIFFVTHCFDKTYLVKGRVGRKFPFRSLWRRFLSGFFLLLLSLRGRFWYWPAWFFFLDLFLSDAFNLKHPVSGGITDCDVMWLSCFFGGIVGHVFAVAKCSRWMNYVQFWFHFLFDNQLLFFYIILTVFTLFNTTAIQSISRCVCVVYFLFFFNSLF